MSEAEGKLQEKTVEELRDEARAQGMSGFSDMRKDELVSALSSSSRTSPWAWVRDRSLGLFFLSIFLLTWVGQFFVEWQVYADEQAEHGTKAVLWSADFFEQFWQSTLENWQSEFLQLAAFTIAATYLVMKGSSESPDSDERLEHKIDFLLKQQGIDPQEVELELPPKYRKR